MSGSYTVGDQADRLVAVDTSADLAIAQRLLQEQATLAAIRAQLLQTLGNIRGTATAEVIALPLVNLCLQKDPFDGSETLYGEWRFSPGKGAPRKWGQVQIHGGGQVFAECDVICPHPTDSRWFVEAVTLWGSRDSIKSELRLLPAVN